MTIFCDIQIVQNTLKYNENEWELGNKMNGNKKEQ